MTMFDPHLWRRQFPILERKVHGKPLVYLDNAATTQKPLAVLDAERYYFEHFNANIHRGVHALSQEASEAFEGAREKIRAFLGAAHVEEIIFTRGATEAINLVAQTWGRTHLEAGDEILISAMEHHANIVPWQMLCEMTGARLKVIPMDERGVLLMDQVDRLLTERTRLVGVTLVSNALGTVNPVTEIIRKAHAVGARVLVDGAQAVAHVAVNMVTLGCDFFVFSGHKLYGPTGIGVLYGKKDLLTAMPPYQGGGDMILQVTFEKTTYNQIPYKFEAGTPHISGAIGLGAAIDFVRSVGLENIAAHEDRLLQEATERAQRVKGLRIIGTAPGKASILSFVLEGIHPHDIGTILDNEGVAIRSGHHCAMPVMDFFSLPATARASFALYNTLEEVERLFQAIERVQKLFLS
ncbi:MAG: SufS family cysteine desulfurase [Ferrovum sp.]|jgi:cysteine desulfurase/selenocysteine lyase|nr:SufS family cysteine desulfurase [Ferrovum sp.]NDU89623.1 cysteine desulfurase [Ferrovum sp.]